MRKKDLERRQALLDCARRIECTEGADALSIRRLASEANIAVGTVYNYFESKQEVLLAMTEEYWLNALKEMQGVVTSDRFSGQIRQIYAFLHEKMNDCAVILMRSLRGDAENGRARMASMQASLIRALEQRLERDASIRKDVWSARFTKEAFASFVLVNLMSILRQKEGNIEIFLEVVERILY